MIDLNAVYWLWYRSLKKILRSKSDIFAHSIEFLILLPLVWVMSITPFFGIEFFLKGVLVILLMNAIASGTTLGIDLIIQRKEGFNQEVYSSPIASFSLSIGLMAGVVSLMTSRFIIIIIFSLILGLSISPIQVILLIFASILVTIISCLISIIFCSLMENIRLLTTSFTLLVISQTFLSGIIIPLKDLPIIILNPLAYTADFLLYAVNLKANFPLLIDITCFISLILILFFLANKIINNIEV